jgi:hypothetical protein
MPTLDQQTNLTNAIDAIRAAEKVLKQQIDAANDPATSTNLTNEFNKIDSLLSQLLQAQNLADDASFTNATAALQSHANTLKTDEAKIKRIVGDVKIAAEVISYITQALAFIAKL